MTQGPLSHGILSVVVIALLSGAFVCPQNVWAQGADNTAQNKNATPTADNQSNAKADRMTTAHIRRALIHDKSLSLDAHNVKIIVQNGNVTLKGPVASSQEKQKVLEDAGTVAGSGNIADELTVKQ